MQRERGLAHNEHLGALATAVAIIANRIPAFSKDVSPLKAVDVLKALPGFTAEE